MGGKMIKGWLPTGWDDNSDWATLAVTYTKLKDGPKEGVTAVRIEVKDLNSGRTVRRSADFELVPE